MHSPPSQTALHVQVVAAPGLAAPGNAEAANFLVVVTNPHTGLGVGNLTQQQIAIINHFMVPGQTAGFTNNITSFHDVSGGAYRIQVKPVNDARWVCGSYLAQVVVSAPNQAGQAATTLMIR